MSPPTHSTVLVTSGPRWRGDVGPVLSDELLAWPMGDGETVVLVDGSSGSPSFGASVTSWCLSAGLPYLLVPPTRGDRDDGLRCLLGWASRLRAPSQGALGSPLHAQRRSPGPVLIIAFAAPSRGELLAQKLAPGVELLVVGD